MVRSGTDKLILRRGQVDGAQIDNSKDNGPMIMISAGKAVHTIPRKNPGRDKTEVRQTKIKGISKQIISSGKR